jgi:hypothetical protein
MQCRRMVTQIGCGMSGGYRGADERSILAMPYNVGVL